MYDISPDGPSSWIPRLVADPDFKNPGHDRLLYLLLRHLPQIVRRMYSPLWSSLVAELAYAKCPASIPSTTNPQQVVNAPDDLKASKIYRCLQPQLFTWNMMQVLFDIENAEDKRMPVGYVDMTAQVKLHANVQVCSRTPGPCLTADRKRDRGVSWADARIVPGLRCDEHLFDRWGCTKRIERFFFDVRYRRPPDSVLIREVLTVAQLLPDHVPCIFTTEMAIRERDKFNELGIVVVTLDDFPHATLMLK